METASIKADKPELGLVKQRKFSLMGQKMLLLLVQLAHNPVVWAKGRQVEPGSELAAFGIQRWARDLFATAGGVVFKAGWVVKVQLRQRNRPAHRFYKPAAYYFARSKIEVALGAQGSIAPVDSLKLVLGKFGIKFR